MNTLCINGDAGPELVLVPPPLPTPEEEKSKSLLQSSNLPPCHGWPVRDKHVFPGCESTPQDGQVTGFSTAVEHPLHILFLDTNRRFRISQYMFVNRVQVSSFPHGRQQRFSQFTYNFNTFRKKNNISRIAERELYPLNTKFNTFSKDLPSKLPFKYGVIWHTSDHVETRDSKRINYEY